MRACIEQKCVERVRRYIRVVPYLGSLVEACGGVVDEVSHRIAQASRAFDSLRDSVFTALDLTDNADQEASILICSVGVLLYGAETWAPNQEFVSKLDQFH